MHLHDAGERLDRLPVTSLHVLALTLCGLGFAFDTLELSLGGILAAVFSAPPHAIPPADLSLLLASVYVGATIGAPLLGWVADRFGRRRTLTGLLLWLACTSLAGGNADGAFELSVWRGLGGVAMGAYPPIVIAYLTDLLPKARRGMLIFVTAAFATLGPPAGIFLVRHLTPIEPLGIEAWRWGFIVGGVGTALVGALFWLLPESPRWLAARGRDDQADATCRRFERSRTWLPANDILGGQGALAATAQVIQAPGRRDRFILSAIFLLSPWATVAFPILTGAVLAQKGFTLSDTLMVLGLSWFGPLLGTLIAATSIDRLDRRRSLGLFAIAMGLAGFLFVATDDARGVLAASVAFSLFSALYVPTLTTYGAELFPTAARARSIAAAWAFNRVGAGCAPLLLLPLLHLSGAAHMFGVVALTLAASVALLALAPRGRQQRSVA